MRLSELVEINEKGIVANSVNFKMMDDPELNQRLCDGFIFNYNEQKPERSTVGILERLRQSFHSKNNPNIHLVIQQYGKGKSHFAVTIANYFQHSFDSAEVQGILAQIENATNKKSKGLAEKLRLYKKDQQHSHLVICLSGDQGGDIKKQFLQTLLNGLEKAGVKDSVAQHLCQEPLRYLESLSEPDKEKANEYLKQQGNPDGDVENLINLLKQNDPNLISTVKDIFKFITGFNPDFNTDIDLEAILEDLLKNLCSGDNAQFRGILILFDELNYYLQCWARDEIGSGGTALQNITNICNNYKGKIALLSFTQIHPDDASGISATSKDSYSKLSTRLTPKEATYYPESSLELVIKNLLIQKVNSQEWKTFVGRWDDTLRSEARNAFDKRIKTYRHKGWSLAQFDDHFSVGCFPLHPLTTYLLCELDFTQDRTAIEFIKGYVKQFILTKPLEDQGKLNYIYPIDLVDTFLENFKHEPIYTFYKKAEDLVSTSDDPNELIVLKALFLYYASGQKLTKLDHEDHENVIRTLTGLSIPKIQLIFDKLIQEREVIYYKEYSKIYRFYEGVNPTTIEREIEEENRKNVPSLQELIEYTNTKIRDYLGNQFVTAKDFVINRKLREEDWQFEYKIYSIDGLIIELSNAHALKHINTNTKGIFAYVFAENKDELSEFRQQISQYLVKSPIKNYITVAIPSLETGDLAKLLLNFNTLTNKDKYSRDSLGRAYHELSKRWNDELSQRLSNLLKDCTYHCIASDKISVSEQNNPQKIISVLLEETYHFVAPIEGIDKMCSGRSTGSEITGWIARELLANSSVSTRFPKQSYKPVVNDILISSWYLLKASSTKNTIQEPTEKNVKAAWDEISKITELNGLSSKKVKLQKIWEILSQAPYGYNYFTFTLLLAGWLAYHRQEIILCGPDKLNFKKRETPTIREQSLKDWASTEIWQKPKDFIQKWVCYSKTQLIRRQKQPIPELPSSPIDYELAQKYLIDIATFLKSNSDSSELVQREELTKNESKVNAEVKKIDAWFTPVKTFESLSQTPSLSDLLPLYSKLQQSYPRFSIEHDIISVRYTKEQKEQFDQTRSRVNEHIEQIISQESKRAESLSSIDECNNYQSVIEQRIEQIGEVQGFPPHLRELLNNALTEAEQRKIELQQQQEQQQKQAEDLSIFQEIQKLKPTKTSTIYDCEEAIKTLECLKDKLNYPDTYNDKIEQISTELSNKIQEYTESLSNIQQQLTSLNQAKICQDLQTDLLKQSLYYENSTLEESYERLSVEIQQLLNLLQILESSNKKTIEDYKSQLNALTQWREEQKEISFILQKQFQYIYQEIENQQQKLIQQRQQEAEQWVNELQKQMTELYSTIDDQEKLGQAEKLLRQLESNQKKYLEFLNQNTLESLNHIKAQCHNEKSKSKANQIIVLFKELPRLQRQDTYEKLTQYLSED